MDKLKENDQLLRAVNIDGREGFIVPLVPDRPMSLGLVWDFIRFPEMMSKVDEKMSFSDEQAMLDLMVDQNTPHIKKCWSELHGKYKRKPAVIMGCGPSLLRQVPFLKAHRDKFVLFGLNRSMRALKPDYFLCIERRGMSEWTDVGDLSGVKAILAPQVDYRVREKFKPENIWWGYMTLGGYQDDKRINWLENMDPRSCISTNIAMYIAWKLGCSPIILLGCDFAAEMDVVHNAEVSPGVKIPTAFRLGRIYFDRLLSDSTYARRPMWHPGNVVAVAGLDGKICGTSRDFLSMMAYCRAICQVLQDSGGVPVYNATPSGIFNWNPKPLHEILGVEDVPCDSAREIYNYAWLNKEYHEFHPGEVLAADIIHAFKQLPIKTVVDVGCGIGRLVRKLRESGFEASGFDGADTAVDMADDPKILRGDLPDGPFDGQQFDAATCIDVLEHLNPGTAMATVARLAKTCRYGVFSVPHHPSEICGPHKENLHLTVQDSTWWRKLFSTYGQVVEMKDSVKMKDTTEYLINFGGIVIPTGKEK